MLINIGGLWDKPISIADDEIFPSDSVEAYQSYEDYTHFKNFSAGTCLGSDLLYGVGAMASVKDFDEICPEKELKSCSARTTESQYAFSHGVSSESKRRKRATGIQIGEDLSFAPSSKSMRLLSGTKDRAGKVNTARGPKDTRVRLSPFTAVKVYEVQYRLGYKHPSKVLDWLISNAQTAIGKLEEPLYGSMLNSRVCDLISNTCSTSSATNQPISTSFQTNDGCSTNSSMDTSRSEEGGNEEVLRSRGLIHLGIPRPVLD